MIGSAGAASALEIDGGPRWSRAELGAAVADQARRLRAAAADAGAEVIALALDRGPTVIGVLAALEAGVPVAVEPALGARIAGRALVVVGLASDRAPAATLRVGAPLDLPPATALLIATSGSTGPAGWAAFDRAGLRAAIERILGYLPVAGARLALTVPLVHAYGLIGQALTGLAGGGTLILPSPRATAAAELATRFAALAVDGWSSVPLALSAVARAVGEIAAPWRPRWLASAGGPLDREVAGEIRAALPSARLFDQYGLTEAGPRVAAIEAGDPAFAAGAVGRPLPGLTLWIDDDGEICLRGPGVMLGYVGASSERATRLDGGVLRTGDRGRLDADGNLHVSGRTDDRVKVAGQWVSLVAVGAALAAAAPDRVAVTAIADPRLGHRVVALVADRDPAAGAATVERIRRHALAHLGPAERPQRYLIVPELPRAASGKLDRDRLRRVAADDAGADVER